MPVAKPVKHITIHSDGGCEGNPGPGGWAAVLASGKHQREVSGAVAATTNNRMELQAAIEALAILKEPCQIEFHTDSEYLRNGITKWIKGWKVRGWRTVEKQPVKNEDLWRQLDAAVAPHQIKWHWLKGHAGHAGNERCDELAGEQIWKLKAALGRDKLKAALAEFTASTKAPQSGSDLFRSAGR